MSARKRFCGALIAVAAVATALSAPAAGTTTSQERLLFSSNRDGTFDLFTMRLDGSDLRKLPPPQHDPQRPDELQAMPSPDGRHIAYVRGRGHSPSPELAQIWLADANGRNHRQLVLSDSKLYRPVWSPDGTTLAVSADTVNPAPGSQLSAEVQLFLVDVATGEVTRQVTTARGLNTFASWSPDGKKIAFAGIREKGQNVYVIDVQSGVERELTSTTTNAAPVWSPDGARILYQSQLDGDQDVYSIDAEGRTAPRNETSTSVDHERFPVWSSDGSMIVYGLVDGASCPVQLAGCSSRIAVRRRDGSPARVLPSTSFDTFPVFLPRPRTVGR